MTVLVCFVAAVALTLYVQLTAGAQYAFDGAAVVAWCAFAYELGNQKA